jgi:hypothetical protein
MYFEVINVFNRCFFDGANIAYLLKVHQHKLSALTECALKSILAGQTPATLTNIVRRI